MWNPGGLCFWFWDMVQEKSQKLYFLIPVTAEPQHRARAPSVRHCLWLVCFAGWKPQLLWGLKMLIACSYSTQGWEGSQLLLAIFNTFFNWFFKHLTIFFLVLAVCKTQAAIITSYKTKTKKPQKSANREFKYFLKTKKLANSLQAV